jgi:hypothetical protein
MREEKIVSGRASKGWESTQASELRAVPALSKVCFTGADSL